MAESLYSFLTRREAELEAEIAEVKRQLAPLEDELADVRRFKGGTAAPSPEPDMSRFQRMTLKQLIVEGLRTRFQSGASAGDLVALFNDEWARVDVVRSSLSPQLSRLKQDNLVKLEDNIWTLVDPASADTLSGEQLADSEVDEEASEAPRSSGVQSVDVKPRTVSIVRIFKDSNGAKRVQKITRLEKPKAVPRPVGIPTIAEMVSEVLADAEREGLEGLTSVEIVARVQKWWPGAVLNDIMPSVHRVMTSGRYFRKEGTRFLRLPTREGKPASAAPSERNEPPVEGGSDGSSDGSTPSEELRFNLV